MAERGPAPALHLPGIAARYARRVRVARQIRLHEVADYAGPAVHVDLDEAGRATGVEILGD